MKFSDNMKLLHNYEIQDLLKLTSDPGVISFAGGIPAPEVFPIKNVEIALNEVMKTEGFVALQYNSTDGMRELREKLAKRMSKKLNINSTWNNIMITSGSQQGLDFAGRIFLNKGDIVLVESPSYVGALNAFNACGAEFIEIPTDKEGMDIEFLKNVLASENKIKMIYIIPDFQNPTGRTWSVERRKEFMEIIDNYDLVVVEDAAYSELQFDGEIFPSLKSMDKKEKVMYLGTMSKILAPGLRIGWICASREILEECNFLKQSADMQTASINQLLISNLLETFDLEGHISKIRKVYKKRRDTMLKSIEKYFPKSVEITFPEGGLFIWCKLPREIDAKNLAKRCIEKKVAFVPGENFFPNSKKQNYFRLNFSCMPEEKIKIGIERIGKIISEI